MKELWLICLSTLAYLTSASNLAQKILTTSTKSPSPTSNYEDLHALHKGIVEIESITSNEEAVGNYLTTWLEDRSFKVVRQTVTENRFNIIAYPGSTPKTKLLLSSHIDTVPPFIPYSINATHIAGRGTVDAKACVAAQTIAVLNILADHPDASVSLLFVIGEEKGGDGMLFFSSHDPPKYEAVVFGEPTEGKLATGHKGMLSFTVEITGKAAHSGYPWLGVSANELLVETLSALLKLEKKLPSSQKLGASTLNIGKVEGGVAGNVIAEHASAEVSIRIAAGTPEEIKGLVEKAVKHVVKKAIDEGGKIEFTYSARGYGPVVIDTDIPGFKHIGVNYGTDIPNFTGDHKKYLYGPGSILVAHAANEGLKITELEESVSAYETMIKHLLDLA